MRSLHNSPQGHESGQLHLCEHPHFGAVNTRMLKMLIAAGRLRQPHASAPAVRHPAVARVSIATLTALRDALQAPTPGAIGALTDELDHLIDQARWHAEPL